MQMVAFLGLFKDGGFVFQEADKVEFPVLEVFTGRKLKRFNR